MIVPPPPPKVQELPRGTQLIAGRGISTVLPDMDFETYSEAGQVFRDGKWRALPYVSQNKKGLGVVGMQVYAEHDSTEVLSFQYDLKDGRGRRFWKPDMPNPQDLFDYLAGGGLIEAHNAGFEERIWTHVCVPKYGWPPLPVRQLRCSMAKARAHCMPAALDPLAKALKLTELKDGEGKRLLNKFSVPRNPTKKDPRLRIRPEEDLEDAEKLYQYNGQDIVVEAAASARLPDLIEEELEYWFVDQECNRSGVQIDMDAVRAALRLLEVQYTRAEAMMLDITNGEVETFTQVQRLADWVRGEGVPVESLDQEALDKWLSSDVLPDHVRKALELRQQFGSAAVKKLYAMVLMTNKDGKAMDLFVYHGARTGRDAGRGLQPQNMPNSGVDVYHCDCGAYFRDPHRCPYCGLDRGLSAPMIEWDNDVSDFAIERILDGTIGLYFYNMPEVLSGCLRGLIMADEGHQFIGTDYSAIEAVVAACLSRCQWRIDTFKNKEDIYLKSVSLITGRPYSEYVEHKAREGVHHPDRKMGKVAELASGYGGWTGAWAQFGAEKHFANEEAIVTAIKAWRNASPEIVEAWGGQQKNWKPHLYGLEGDFIRAFYSPDVEIPSVCDVSFLYSGGNMYLKLPSGRYITYHEVSVKPDSRREGKMAIWFWGWNSNPTMGKMGWTMLNTYGGRLFENVVQAVARDIMSFAAVRAHRAGYFIKLRVHDELVAQTPIGVGSVEQFEQICNTLPSWAQGWPVRVSDGWAGKRYRK